MSWSADEPSRVAPAWRRLLGIGRLVRYGVAGAASALTHLGTLVALVELADVRPVWASNVGFALSIAVSYTLQHRWVFASTTQHRLAVPRFVAVTAVGLALNSGVMLIGTEVLAVPYPLTQAVALLLIPVSNFVLNSLWTFR